MALVHFPHNLHLLFRSISSIFVLSGRQSIVFYAAIKSDSVSFFMFPFRSHVQIFSVCYFVSLSFEISLLLFFCQCFLLAAIISIYFIPFNVVLDGCVYSVW